MNKENKHAAEGHQPIAPFWPDDPEEFREFWQGLVTDAGAIDELMSMIRRLKEKYSKNIYGDQMLLIEINDLISRMEDELYGRLKGYCFKYYQFETPARSLGFNW